MRVCEVCGKEKNDWGFVTYHGQDMCNSCYNEHIYQCPCCGGTFDDRLVKRSDKEVNGRKLCPQCARHLHKCELCGKQHYSLFSDDNGTRYCETCLNRAISSYHHSMSAFPFFAHRKTGNYKSKRDANGGLYFGLELEMDQDSEKCDRKYKFTLLKLLKILNGEAYFETDCSLGTNGAELITFPHTIDAMYNIKWEEVFKTAVKNKYRSHNSGRCGLHMHFNKAFFGRNQAERTENIAKVLVFYNVFWDDLMKFSRRDKESSYAYRPKLNSVNDSDYLSQEKEKKDNVINRAKEFAGNTYSSRYNAVNLSTGTKNTVEFRIMRGTLNYSTFMACMDFNIQIATMAKKLSWEDVWDYKKWLSGCAENTIDYMKSRKCFANMYDSETQENKEEGSDTLCV